MLKLMLGEMLAIALTESTLDVRPIRSFVAVAEEWTFTRAAARMNISQPALSGQISRLEEALGFPLFTRTTRRVVLTPKGRSLLPAARRMAGESENFARTLRELRGGPRRLTVAAAHYTADTPERTALIEGFIEAHPQTELDIDYRWQATTMPDVLAGHLDLALVLGAPIPRSEYERLMQQGEPREALYPEELALVVLRRRRIKLLVPAESSLARFDVIPLSALADVPVATPMQNGAPLFESVDAVLRSSRAQIVTPPEATGDGVARYAARFRIAAVSLGWFDVLRHERGPMVRRPVAGLEAFTDLVLLGSARTLAAAAFRRFAMTWAEAAHRPAAPQRLEARLQAAAVSSTARR